MLLPKMTAIKAGIPRSEINAAIIVASEKPASGYMRFSFFLSRRPRIVASSSKPISEVAVQTSAIRARSCVRSMRSSASSEEEGRAATPTSFPTAILAAPLPAESVTSRHYTPPNPRPVACGGRLRKRAIRFTGPRSKM